MEPASPPHPLSHRERVRVRADVEVRGRFTLTLTPALSQWERG
jgi:hypothetical protein